MVNKNIIVTLFVTAAAAVPQNKLFSFYSLSNS